MASNPIIISVKQTSATSVMVEWSQPSGGATVTGYVVHYSDGVTTDVTDDVPASSTSSFIRHLINCRGYTFMLEAMSEHLSGESYTNVFELGRSLHHNTLPWFPWCVGTWFVCVSVCLSIGRDIAYQTVGRRSM